MSDHLDAALYFERLAERATRPADREGLLATAREFRWLAIADGRRFVREMPKRPAAPSIRRDAERGGELKGSTHERA
jgi:hypothetical protein